MALGEYEHTRDVASGAVAPEGIDLVVSQMPLPRIVQRFMRHLEFEVAELSFANYCTMFRSGATPPAIAIPVFTSRVFRHSAIYVRADSGLHDWGDLRGKRIGIPQWSQTACVFVRGLMADVGVPLQDIAWVQAGIDEAGRAETARGMVLPRGITVTPDPEHNLAELLLSGAIDAVISAVPPAPFCAGNPAVRRLFADPAAHERVLLQQTGVFPIMHLMVLRRDTYEQHRWIARNLLDAFETAKRNAFARIMDLSISYLPVAWGPEYVAGTNAALFGPAAPWPYGVEANRRTIETFLRYCGEQGLTDRQLTPDDLFAPECLQELRH
jgi:4,5-dihydroxyphthalate decarboxylase